MKNVGISMPQLGSPARLGRIASTLLTLNVAGFIFVSFLPVALSLNNRTVSIPFRALLVALCLYLMWTALRLGRLRIPSALDLIALAFWFLYLTRFAIDTVFNPVSLGMGNVEFVEYLVGSSLMTYVAFSVISDTAAYRRAFDWIAVLLACNCALSYFFHSNTLNAGQGQGRLEANDLISPIYFGHMGLTTFLWGLFIFLGFPRRDPSAGRSVFAIILMMAGVFVLLSSGSRGAFVAGAILLLLLVGAAVLHGAGRRMIWASLFIGMLLPTLVGMVIAAGVPLQEYVGSANAFLESSSTVNREGLARLGWEEFLEHPLLGSSMVERRSLTYPHNYVIESFMATGMLGGSLFCVLILAGVWRSLTLLYRHPEDGWISMLFLQSLIAGMFSGGLYFAPWFWGMLGVVLFAKHKDTEPDFAMYAPAYSYSCIAMQSMLPVEAAPVSDAIVT